ncbi:MAG: type I restriction enzyme HsdR N-terminal domain-containing protein [Bacteroidales bacterium]|nr:type I restriction enzyme HsdR N-terminal domain-containing protein [Bacteroidales bacterium]
MLQLNLPEFSFRLKRNENKVKIFDIIRKTYVILTPEEWVRQHFIMFLIEEKKVPVSHIALEREFKLFGTSKRFDAVVFNNKSEAVILLEFKAPHVELGIPAYEQINTYNTVFNIPYLVLSNGISHFCYHFVSKTVINQLFNIYELPMYDNL